MNEANQEQSTLELIASYAWDFDISVDARMNIVLNILSSIGLDYSNKGDDNAELV